MVAHLDAEQQEEGVEDQVSYMLKSLWDEEVSRSWLQAGSRVVKSLGLEL